MKNFQRANSKLKTFLGVFFVLFFVSTTFAVDRNTTSQTNFDEGVYNDTTWDSDHVGLSATKTNGIYTSKIFNAGGITHWNNISWTQGGFYQQELPNNKLSESGAEAVDMTGNILLYHMNDSAGAIIDNSGEGNNGTANGVLYGQPGKFNTSIGFDGTNDYIDTNLTTNLSSGSFSVFTRVKDIPSGSKYIVSQTHTLSSYSSDWILGYTNGGLRFRAETIDGSNIISDGGWHNLGFTFDGTTAKLYIDGVFIGSSTPTGFSGTGSVKVMTRGDASTSFTAGDIDEVSIYDRVLSSSEILNHYKRGAQKFDIEVRSCDDSACDTESWSNLGDISPQNLSESSNQYFQYRYNFTTDNINYSPKLFNVNVNYDPVVVPGINITDDVEVGPVKNDIIIVTWTDAIIKKRMYDTDGACSTFSGDYTYNYTGDIVINTENNNSKYICFYGESVLGNITTIVSSQTVNIDITPPTYTGVLEGVHYNTTKNPTYSDTNAVSATLNGSGFNSGDPVSLDSAYTLIITDAATNQTIVHFTIDTIVPSVSGVLSGGLYASGVSIVYSDSNLNTATLDGNPYSSNAPITSEGSHIFYVDDYAGNSKTISFDIDNTAPTWTVNDGTESGSVNNDTINVTATDSNLDSANLYYGFSSDSTCDSSDTYSTIFTNSTDFNIAGDHTDYLCVKGNDTVGNTSYQLVGQLNTDNTAPNISFTDDVEVGPIQADSIAATWGDATIKKREYNVDVMCPVISGSYSHNYTIPFTENTEDNNSKYICLYAEDSLGNKAVLNSANSLNIDITKPTASVLYNPSALTNTDVLAILTGESESITIDSVGGNTHNFATNGSFLFEYHDVAGNTGESLATVNRIDKTPPTLTGISTVTTSNSNTGFAKAGDVITVTFSVTEDLVQNPSVNIIGGGVFNFAGKLGHTYSYNRVMQASDPDGTINISVAMEDLATNINSENISSSIIFDSSSPAGIIITAPTLEQRLKGSNGVDPAINFDITRDIGTETNYGPNPLQIQYSSIGDFSDAYNISTGTDNDGSYSWTIPANYNTDTAMIRIIATDSAGNSNTFNSPSFNIDSIRPTEVTIHTPSGTEFLKGGDEYNLSYAGGVESNIATQQYWLSYNAGGSSQAVAIHAGNKRDVPSNINSQDVVFNIKVTDKAGRRNDGNSNTFTIDNILPTLSFDNSSSRRNTTVNGTTTVGDNFALRLTGNHAVYKSSAFTDSCAGGTLTVPTYSTDGTYTSYACIEDRAGNVTTGQQVYNIDKTIPFVDAGSDKITNTGILQGTVVNDILSGGVFSDIASVYRTQELGPGTVSFHPMNTGNTNISADIDGIYLLRLTAIDNAGNITTGDINFTRDTLAPVITGGTVTNTNTSSPGYSFQSNETGAISYSGSCGNGNKSIVSIGTNTFNYSSRSDGVTYSDCQLIIHDLAGNTVIQNVPSFTIHIPAPSGGGGGGGGAKKDNCSISSSDLPGANEEGEDYSPSKYDKTCLAEEEEDEEIIKEIIEEDEPENTVVVYGNTKASIFALISIPHFDDSKFENSMGVISDYIADKVSKKSIPVSELSSLLSYYNTFLSKFAEYKNDGNESAQDEAVVALSTFMSKLNKYDDAGVADGGDELSMAIQFLYNNGLTKYSTKATFRPDALITREQAAKFIVVYAQKMKGVTIDSNKTYIFADINEGDPTLKDYIIKSYQMGIFNGYGSVFKPHRNLTRGGALAVLLRVYLGDGLNEYNYPRYKDYYNKALELGLTTDKNIRSGDKDITRGELALFIYRVSQK